MTEPKPFRPDKAARIRARAAPLCFATALASLSSPGTAQAQSHAEQVNVYARVLSAITFAEQACPGFRANTSKLSSIRTRAQISDAEDGAIADKIRDSTASTTATFARVGQNVWCDDTYRQLGPRGTLVADALVKKP